MLSHHLDDWRWRLRCDHFGLPRKCLREPGESAFFNFLFCPLPFWYGPGRPVFPEESLRDEDLFLDFSARGKAHAPEHCETRRIECSAAEIHKAWFIRMRYTQKCAFRLHVSCWSDAVAFVACCHCWLPEELNATASIFSTIASQAVWTLFLRVWTVLQRRPGVMDAQIDSRIETAPLP